MEHL
jgi:hypothetical protein